MLAWTSVLLLRSTSFGAANVTAPTSVAEFVSSSRANAMADHLNEIFDDHPGADLDFIHAYKSVPGEPYEVAWPAVAFAQEHAFFSRVNYADCNSSGRTQKAWEEVYRAGDVDDHSIRTIHQVLDADADSMGCRHSRSHSFGPNHVQLARTVALDRRARPLPC